MKQKLIVFLFFVYGYCSVAQELVNVIHYDNVFLTKVLLDLEKQFDITFAYNATDIAQQRVTLHIENPSLKKVISVLEGAYQISFTKIDEQYYSLITLDHITICGYLKDAVNGNTVVGASVFNIKKKKGTVSTNEGFFKLDNNSISDTLAISYLGFKTLRIPVQSIRSKNCITYTMFSENYTLNEVVIQDYLSSGVVKINDGAIKIKPNNLDVLAGLSEPDVLQTMQLLPGVESPNENATGLHVRGGSPDQNLLLWDGIKMYNADHFFGILSSFNHNITESIRFYRSGANPTYGDRISGVIDIKTKTTIPEKLKGGVGINATYTDAYLHFPVAKNTGILVSARRSITDIVNTPTITNFGTSVFQNTSITNNEENFDADIVNDNGRFYFADATFKLHSKLSEKDELTTGAIYTKNKLNYTLKVAGFEENNVDNLVITNSGANLNWNRKWNNRLSSNTQVYFSNYEFTYFGINPFLVETLTTTKTNTIKEYGIKLHTDLRLDNNFVLSTGYQFFSNQVAYTLQNLDFNERDDRTNPTHSFYAGLNYVKAKKWYVDIGLRAEYYTLLQNVFLEPRIYGQYYLNDFATVNASLESRNQSISQILEFASLDFGLENQVWALSDNEDNPLLASNQASLGFSYNKNGWKFDSDFYYRNIDGFTSLTRNFAPSDNTTDFSIGFSEILGVDVLVKKRFNNYATWVSYTFSHNNFRFDDLNQGNNFRGNNNSRHSFTWSHAYTLNKFQFSLGWKYRTGIPYTDAIGIEQNGEDYTVSFASINAETLPSYHRLDASVLYNFNWSKKNNTIKGKIGFSLLNIYNRRNLLNRNFSVLETTDDQNNTTARLQTINRQSLGITPNLFIRVDF